MSDKLTPEQEALRPVYEQRWIGYLTEPLDEVEAAEAIRKLYAHNNLPMPLIIYGDSPQHCVDLAKGKYSREEVLKAISAGEDVNKRLNDKMIKKDSSDIFGGMYNSTWWGAWAAHYEFQHEVLGKSFDQQAYKDFIQFVRNIGFSIVFDDVVFLSRKPVEVNIVDGKMHADLKKALVYKDGYGLYVLNNVAIPKEYSELVTTPAEDLSLDLYKRIKSADVKIEFVAKFGVERMKSLGEVIDSYENYRDHEYWDRFIFGKSKYELIDMSSVYNGDSAAIFLGMVHQGNGSYIMECVGEGNKTIKQALESRMSTNLDEYFCESFH